MIEIRFIFTEPPEGIPSIYGDVTLDINSIDDHFIEWVKKHLVENNVYVIHEPDVWVKGDGYFHALGMWGTRETDPSIVTYFKDYLGTGRDIYMLMIDKPHDAIAYLREALE